MTTAIDWYAKETVWGVCAAAYLLWEVAFSHLGRKRLRACRYRSVRKLKRTTWRTFEEICAELFDAEGWRILRAGKSGADGGIDIVMQKRGKKAIVQCKRYRDAPVGVKTVREMYGLLHEHDADEAYIVTSSGFTKESLLFVEGKPIVLIDAAMLVKRLKRRCR